ncbi:hypothetical protein D6779_04840 [Candidatus Parcubacteria bacterium]|nr:MAG: hypothetical protein D6779_04840 [Candidatus Parcubacteria bacterium]
MPSPRQIFEDNIRPAVLLLQVYRLLDADDRILTEGELVDALKSVVHADDVEYVMVIANEVFLGMVRESAQVHPATLRRATLCHLLRQAIVISSTALETFLPALLRQNLPTVIQAMGRDFVPTDDRGVSEYFRDLTFSLDETLRLMGDPNAALYISQKILGLTKFKYLSSRKGVHVVARLLGLNHPWKEIAEHLGRDKEELMRVLEDAINRRNDIVHRADRSREDPEGEPQEITYSWTKQAVDTIQHICLALDELVSQRVKEYSSMLESPMVSV